MKTTRCQLPSSGAGCQSVGSMSSNTNYPFQPLMALHNPRNIHATDSRGLEGVKRVEVPGVRQTSPTIRVARVGDRDPPNEQRSQPRTLSSTTFTSTPRHNHPHRPNSNGIEVSGAVSVASRSNGAHPSNAPRAHLPSPPSSVSGPQSDRHVYQSGISLQNGAENTQPSSAIQPTDIVSIATRLNSEIARLSPPLQAMANYLLLLMGEGKEERLRWLEMNIPYLWVWMPPLLLWLRIFLGSRSDQGLDVGGSGAGAPPKDEASRRDHEGEIVGTHAHAPTREAAQQDPHRQSQELQKRTVVYADTPENCEGSENTPSPSIGNAGARLQAAQPSQSHDSYGWPGGQMVQGPRRSQPPPPAHPRYLMPAGMNIASQDSITSQNAYMRPNNRTDDGPSSNVQNYIRHSSLPTDDERQANRNTPVIIQLEERLPDPLTAEDAQDRIHITGWAYEQDPTPGSSSGASRKRGSDQIDDDGVGAPSVSASKPKRPRRNNMRGLKPSASSSRAGTTAGGSDLPENK